MFGKNKKKKNEKGGTGTMGATVQELVDALKKWKAAVEERDNLLKAAYAENKSLKDQVKTVSDERDALKTERDGLKKTNEDLSQQLGKAKTETTDPPAPPKPE